MTAGRKITALPSTSVALTLSDKFPAVQSGVTYQEALQKLFDLFQITASLIVWTDVTTTSQSMLVNNGYIADNVGLVTLTLPVTAKLGTQLLIQGKGAGGWSIAQNAGQQIQIGSSATTVGVAGSVSSTNRWDSLQLVCVTDNTTWACIGGPQGALTIV